jgi:DNA-directed RNA polymerase sigma subunit (sigma70/sigma32)
MNTKLRIPDNPELIAKQVMEYYFQYPEANSLKEIEEIFNISPRRIRKIISDNLKKRLDNSLLRRCARH